MVERSLAGASLYLGRKEWADGKSGNPPSEIALVIDLLTIVVEVRRGVCQEAAAACWTRTAWNAWVCDQGAQLEKRVGRRDCCGKMLGVCFAAPWWKCQPQATDLVMQQGSGSICGAGAMEQELARTVATCPVAVHYVAPPKWAFHDDRHYANHPQPGDAIFQTKQP